MKKRKETDRGIETREDGYVIIEKDPEFQALRDLYKVPFTCYSCGMCLDNWDTNYFYRYGVCCKCSINYIEGRDFDDVFLRDRNKIIEYCKSKEEEKKNKHI